MDEINKDFFIDNLLSTVEDKETKDKLRETLTKTIQNYSISFDESTLNNENFEEHNLMVLDTFLEAKTLEGKSAGTIKLYKLYILDFLKFVNKPLDKITPHEIRNYLNVTQKTRGISNRTLDSRRSAISAFLSWSNVEKVIDFNPAENVAKVKYERVPKTPLSNKELAMVREACFNVRDRALIEFLYSTGARLDEVRNTKITDINFDKNEVTLLGKGNIHRKVYLSETANFYLKQYLALRKDKTEFLFVASKQLFQQLSKSGIQDIVKRIGKAAGLERTINPHLFRHTCATHLLQHGMDVTEIQKILGHANVTTTMIYSKNADEDIKSHHKKFLF